jgi:hypothetical protein
MRTYKGTIKNLPINGIFVFGANTQFRHGKGSALLALKKFGAVYGEGGHQGQSYAIVTKDLTKFKHPSVSKEYIVEQIKDLYRYAIDNKNLDFYVVYQGVGSNLNSYTPKEMAEMFRCDSIPRNMVFEEEFSKLIAG